LSWLFPIARRRCHRSRTVQSPFYSQKPALIVTRITLRGRKPFPEPRAVLSRVSPRELDALLPMAAFNAVD
jgi:hypothetical protein